jgi:hypothetical protein
MPFLLLLAEQTVRRTIMNADQGEEHGRAQMLPVGRDHASMGR